MTGTLLGVVITTLLGVGTAILRLVLKYRRSLARESQSFLKYVIGNVRLSIGRHVRKSLAGQFGVRRYAELKLATFPARLFVPSVDGAAIDIDTAYVRLSLSGARRRVTDDDLLADDAGSVLLFGDPGSGKSSLTKKLFRQTCRKAFTHPDTNRLPLHVELRGLGWAEAKASKQDAGAWLRGELFRLATQVEGVHDPRFALDAWAGKNGLLVLLDGMDEVPERCLDFAGEAIQDLIASLRGKSPHTSVIVTARTQLRGALSRGFIDGMNAVYTVEPFTAADVFEFLRKWPYPAGRSGEAQRILNTLLEHRTLAEMCGNPLILSMYVAQDQRYTASPNLGSVRLPDTRTEFYSSVIGELLVHRHSQQFGQGQGASETRRAREELLGKIALDHLYGGDDPANSISWRDAVHTTQRLTGLSTTAKAEAHLRALAIDTGIFTEERPGETLRFMHLTLCEYLAAIEASESGVPAFPDLADALFASPGAQSSRLSEVVIFTLTMFKRSDRLRALDDLHERGASPALLLRAARECQAYESTTFTSAATALRRQLTRTDVARWNEQWFADIRLLMTCLDEARRSARPGHPLAGHSTEHLLRQLTRNDSQRLDRLFEMWLEFNPAEALTTARLLRQLDPQFDLTRRFVAALERIELLMYAMSRVSTLADDQDHWTPLLAEAALTAPLVAQKLVNEPPPTSPVKRAGETWETTGAAKNTLLGWVLTRAADQFATLPGPTRTALARLGLLTAVSPSDTLFPDGSIMRTSAVGFARNALFAGPLGAVSVVLGAVLGIAPALTGPVGVLLCSWALIAAWLAVILVTGNKWSVDLADTRGPEKTQTPLLNLAPRLAGIRPSCVIASVDGGTKLYVNSTTPTIDDPSPSDLPRPDLLPTVTPGLVVDLRGMKPALQATYLLTNAFTFDHAVESAHTPLPRRSLEKVRTLLLLAASGRVTRVHLVSADRQAPRRRMPVLLMVDLWSGRVPRTRVRGRGEARGPQPREGPRRLDHR